MLMTIIKALIVFLDLVMIFVMTKVMNDNEEYDPWYAKLLGSYMICMWGADIMIIWQGI